MTMTEPTKPIDDEVREAIRRISYHDSSTLIQDEFMQLITADRKQLLDRMEKGVIGEDCELRADSTEAIDHAEDWLQGAGISPGYDYLRINGLANAVKAKQRIALAKLWKELGL